MVVYMSTLSVTGDHGRCGYTLLVLTVLWRLLLRLLLLVRLLDGLLGLITLVLVVFIIVVAIVVLVAHAAPEGGRHWRGPITLDDEARESVDISQNLQADLT